MDGVDVLVVDHDAGVRASIADVLAHEGFSAAAVSGGREALDYLGASPNPRLILLELEATAFSARDFRAAQLADETLARIPVVILTTSPAARHEVASLGAAEERVRLSEARLRLLIDSVRACLPRSRRRRCSAAAHDRHVDGALQLQVLREQHLDDGAKLVV